MQFIDYYNKHNILFIILFSHSTHQLQFLNVFIFYLFINVHLNSSNCFIYSI